MKRTSKHIIKKKNIPVKRPRARLQPHVKVWLETSDGYVIGDGRAALLRAIEEHGSLNRAASELGMSFRAAWGHLREMERRLGATLIQTERGGAAGGGTRLTPYAKKLLKAFDTFSRRVHRAGADFHELL